MLNPLISFNEAKKVVPELKGIEFGQMRNIVFQQNFLLTGTSDPSSTLTQLGPTPQQFAAGAIIIGITATATPVTQPVQPFLLPRQRFQLGFNYTQSDALTAGTGTTGLGNADALLGSGADTIFPSRFLYMPPQQSIFTTIANLTPETLRATVAFHALVWRFAQ